MKLKNQRQVILYFTVGVRHCHMSNLEQSALVGWDEP